MPPDWILDELTLADYAAALDLWSASPGVNSGESLPEFERILARNPGMSAAARKGDQLVGAVLCCHDGRRGYLYHLAVEPAYRKLGIAKALVDRCLAQLAREGIARCSIHLLADNADGAAFWQRIGWRERTDLIVMAKDLE